MWADHRRHYCMRIAGGITAYRRQNCTLEAEPHAERRRRTQSARGRTACRAEKAELHVEYGRYKANQSMGGRGGVS